MERKFGLLSKIVNNVKCTHASFSNLQLSEFSCLLIKDKNIMFQK